MQVNFSAIEAHIRAPRRSYQSARRRAVRHRSDARNVFLCLLGLVITVMATMLSLHYFMPSNTKTVTFNQAALSARFVAQMSQYNLSDETLRLKTDAFSEALRDALQDYAVKHHVLVLNAKNVMAGGLDVTDAVAELVASRMRTSS